MGYLALEDGSIFEGKLIGAAQETMGELVFNTNMTGYQEAIVDPANCGQIVVMTYPLIGNYGINIEDMEGTKPYLAGLVVRELCEIPSNWRATSNLNDYLKEHNIVGIADVDTREIIRIIREKGNLCGKICADLPTAQEIADISKHKEIGLVEKVTCSAPYTLGGQGVKLAVIDYGVSNNILQPLIELEAQLTIFPATISAQEILNGGYSGLILSSGPGNPKDCTEQINTIKQLFGKLPIFGIGLGHQVLALACGGDTYKLKCGHGGAQSVKELATGKLFMASQNHNYNVHPEHLPKGAKVSFLNWNDKTIEGLKYKNGSFSVQFYPCGGAGPNDAAFLFEKFIGITK